MNTFTFTKANQEDLEQILSLQKKCYQSEAAIYNDFEIEPLTQTIESIAGEFKTKMFLKLEDNNTIIASARAFEENGTCYIGKLIVDENHQNKGIGAALLSATETHFPNVKRFELFTGDKSKRNLYLYNKLGYKQFKEESIGEFSLVFLEKLI